MICSFKHTSALAHSVPCYLEYPSLSCSLGQSPFILKSLLKCHFSEFFPDTPTLPTVLITTSFDNLKYIPLCHRSTHDTVL